MNEGTSHGAERDSKDHGHGGVGEDNRVHASVEPDVKDQ